MRYLGIDFGSKRVGIALSDEGNMIAFPLTVLENSPRLISDVGALCAENGIGSIVLGESKDNHGEYNKIMEAAFAFKERLEKELGILVLLEPEFMTSAQAERQHHAVKPPRTERSQRGEKPSGDPSLDASAAAILLQSYLDRNNQKPETHNK